MHHQNKMIVKQGNKSAERQLRAIEWSKSKKRIPHPQGKRKE
jgi:hypothetical protein